HNTYISTLYLHDALPILNKISVRTKSPSGFASVNAGVLETAEYILGFGKNKADWTYNIQYTASLYDTNYKWIVRNKDSHYSKWKSEDNNEIVASQHCYNSVREARNKLAKEIVKHLQGQHGLEHTENVFRYTAIGNDAGQKVIDGRDLNKTNINKIYEIKREHQYTVNIHKGQELALYSKKGRE